ncbi:DUF305 domain-containing protein [Paraburkholderia saeva]|uniref:DUF305 domain-containing protein n=1 Tax=Paraburkholderia saeva TaxID=2777537 RepID=UPI001DE5551F|nr:DUF305 domain-containing protein [Paraburkholderia saeva]CAG4903526.1 hypothetical protein R52603_03100 [Paraburkholderia saeva]
MQSRLPYCVRAAIALAFCNGLMISPAFAGDAGPTPTIHTDESSFIAENDDAMTKMMNDMSIKPTGNVDEDFVAMMIPHHQGAIDMAQAELRHGHNEQLRRIAQEIVVEQQQEIVAMRVALNQPLPPSLPAPDQQGAPHSSAPSAHPMSDHSMSPMGNMHGATSMNPSMTTPTEP